MNRTVALAFAGVMGLLAAGCHDAPPPPQTPVPAADGQTALRTSDPPRPIDMPDYDGAPPGTYSDVPLIVDNPPETRDFLAAYNRVGKPRLTLFVNRTLEGHLLPVERREGSGGGGTDPFADPNKGVEAALRSGLYDDAAAKSIDYEAIENVLTDWLMAGGQTTMISPTLVRQKLTEQQIRDLTSGKLIVNAEIAEQLGADVLVQVAARPTRQTPAGVEVRIVAEAMNIKGGQALGHAVVDVAPPLEKPAINRATRFLARKLMNGMTGTWRGMAEAPRPAPSSPSPGTPGEGRGEGQANPGGETPSRPNPLSKPPVGAIDQGPDQPTIIAPQPPSGSSPAGQGAVTPNVTKPPVEPIDPPVPVPPAPTPPPKPVPPGPIPPPNPIPPSPVPPPVPPVPPVPPTQPAPPPPAPMPPGTQPAPLAPLQPVDQ